MRSLLSLVVLSTCCGAPKSETGPPEGSDTGTSFDASLSPKRGSLSEEQEDAKTTSRAFPQDKLRLAYQEDAEKQSLRLFRWQEFAQAKAALEASPRAKEGSAFLALRGRIRESLGEYKLAGEDYAKAAESEPAIAGYLHYRAAISYGAGKDARGVAEAAMVEANSPWRDELAFARAQGLRVQGKLEQALDLYSAYVEGGKLAPTHLAEALFHLSQLDKSSDKVLIYKRRLVSEFPVSEFAERLVRDERALLASLSRAEKIKRGLGLFDAQRNGPAALLFASILKGKNLSPADRCVVSYHRAKSVYKDRQYPRAQELFSSAARDCLQGKNSDLAVKAAYQGGVAAARRGRHDEAIALYKKAEQYPEHSYADDARLRQAEELFDLGKRAEARATLTSIPLAYPQGDMRAEAMWRLARDSYVAGQYEDAAVVLRDRAQEIGRETQWWAEGQGSYWLGRSLSKLGKNDKALLAYRKCIEEHPLTYYSMQAFARMRELDPKAAEDLQGALKEQQRGASVLLPPSEIYVSQEFKRSLRLAQLGFSKATKESLAHMGWNVPLGRKAETDAAKQQELRAMQLLLDLGQDYENSHWIGRWHLVEYRKSWPTGPIRVDWDLAYPRGYWALIQKFAETYSYPSDLQMAIVREESAFDPSRESWANAIGLTQMIFPTAIDHSKESGIAVNRKNLKHPVKNVTIGSHFLQSLQDAFEGRVGLMVPGYNAGRARVRGWIRSRHKLDLDEFIESIPGDQARRYTKRVLGSFATYTYLRTGALPVMRNEVPWRLSKLGGAKK